MSLVSILADTGAALRLQFEGLTPNTIDLKTLPPHLRASENGPRETDETLRSFARQVCMDMQIAGGVLSPRPALANEAGRLDR
ncbi:hypothetical protein [Methylocapsa sp. S129]|uniref:hypothetical protein n=1 Tax=Methylocapsa sp. S129 TaxID=1641869 RepID=UPI00131BBBF8|nr:hypothetical protein [Methylocapsa sp. S129]